MANHADERTEFISELINLLAGPVSTGVRAAGQINQRRLDLQTHLEEAVAELRHVAAVGQRMVALLDEIEGPIREAIPQITRASRLLGEILDEAPDDLGPRLVATLSGLNGLVDGLGPMAAMAQGMFGQRPPAATPPAQGVQPESKTVPAKKTAARKTAAKKVPAKKAPAKKATTKKVSTKKTAAPKATAKKPASRR